MIVTRKKSEKEIMDLLNLFFSPQGRISIKHYWLGVAVIFVAFFLFTWLLGVTFSAVVQGLPMKAIAIPSIIFGFLSFAWQLGLFYIFVCVASKRAHDSGKSLNQMYVPLGWLLGALVAIFVLGTIVFLAIGGGKSISDLLMLSTLPIFFGIVAGKYIVPIIVVLAIVFIGIGTSDPYENEYGVPSQR
jgi:uncharacterized membrane protein YhaH (DUF805 family)